MSSLTRKHKRRIAFQCAKQGLAPAQAVAESAARELKITKDASAEVIEYMLRAMGLVVQYDFGKLHVKETRLEKLAQCLYKRSIQVKKHQFNEEETKTCQRFAGAVMEIWEQEEAK